MRRAEHLIRQVRNQTENTQTGVTDGISDEEFIQYLNDGQDSIYNSLILSNPQSFTKVVRTSTVKGQEEYDLPYDLYMDHRLVMVEFTDTGKDENLHRLERRKALERNTTEAYPCWYAVIRRKLVVSPIPFKGVTDGLRIHYDPRLPRLDKRRTTVASSTVTAGALTALTLDNTDPLFNVDDYDLNDYLSVCDRDGVVLASGIPYDSVSAAGVVTISGGSFTLRDGDTSVPVGSYVTLGEYSTTNSHLAQLCERYLLAYAALKVFRRDSSSDSMEQDAELKEIKNEILQNYADPTGDVTEIPVSDYEIFDLDLW